MSQQLSADIANLKYQMLSYSLKMYPNVERPGNDLKIVNLLTIIGSLCFIVLIITVLSRPTHLEYFGFNNEYGNSYVS